MHRVKALPDVSGQVFGELSLERTAFLRAVRSIALAGTVSVAKDACAQPVADPTEARRHHDAGVAIWTRYVKDAQKDAPSLSPACDEFEAATRLVDTDASYFRDLAVCLKAQAKRYLDPGDPSEEVAANVRAQAYEAAQRAIAIPNASMQVKRDAEKIIDETTCYLEFVVPSDWSAYMDNIGVIGDDDKEVGIAAERWNVVTRFTPGVYELKLQHLSSNETQRAQVEFYCLGEAKFPTVLDVAELLKENPDPPDKNAGATEPSPQPVASPDSSAPPPTPTPPGCQCRGTHDAGAQIAMSEWATLVFVMSALMRRRRRRSSLERR